LQTDFVVRNAKSAANFTRNGGDFFAVNFEGAMITNDVDTTRLIHSLLT
jgi:hypothetical protein